MRRALLPALPGRQQALPHRPAWRGPCPPLGYTHLPQNTAVLADWFAPSFAGVPGGRQPEASPSPRLTQIIPAFSCPVSMEDSYESLLMSFSVKLTRGRPICRSTRNGTSPLGPKGRKSARRRLCFTPRSGHAAGACPDATFFPRGARRNRPSCRRTCLCPPGGRRG